MGFYLYCIGPAGLPLPATPGLDDAPLLLVESRGLAACASVREEAPAATLPRVRRHHEVIHAATSRRATPLPVRFGQWFPTRDALVDRLAGAEGELVRALAAVRGALEFTVRVHEAPAARPPMEMADPPPAGRTRGSAAGFMGGREGPGARGPGRAYMRELARRYGEERAARERGLEAVEQLRSRLGPLARAERVEVSGEAALSDGAIASVAHLIPRAQMARYTQEVRRFGAGRPALRVEVHGPYPPYSFAR